jgi:hypothetical protein
MSSVRVPGSVYRRASGRWAAVSPPFDPGTGRRRRLSLGTFESRVDALKELADFHGNRRPVEVIRLQVREYLARWLALVTSQVEVGHSARRTASSNEQAVRLHISPALGHLRLAELNHHVIHGWLTSLRKARGLSDQTVPQTVDLLRSQRVRLAQDRLRAGEDYDVSPLEQDLVFRKGPKGGLVRADVASAHSPRSGSMQA